MSLSWNLSYDLINLQFFPLLEVVPRLGGFDHPTGHFMAYDYFLFFVRTSLHTFKVAGTVSMV
jgi:hypothetical protein